MPVDPERAAAPDGEDAGGKTSHRHREQVEVLHARYKRWISPVLHGLTRTFFPFSGGCRFQPTCSDYAAIAVARHGWLRGGGMALLRLLRCRPFSRGGFDPVP